MGRRLYTRPAVGQEVVLVYPRCWAELACIWLLGTGLAVIRLAARQYGSTACGCRVPTLQMLCTMLGAIQ